MTENPITRRTVLTIGGASATAIALAACSPSGGSAPSSSASRSAAAPSTSAVPSAEASAPAGGGTEIAKLADIPVGGSIDAKLNGAPILVSQPTAGTVVAFSAICTHQGCIVAAAGKEFDCPCHNSSYDAATGEVLGGPAPKPLPKVAVSISGDAVIAS
ncbi:Rieske (2Fe-2S) protein [Glaciibacter flavus]|uniref:Cytochrome bc1 complex Rieske iron-sulfur subunit n=1 Tax=Orlajensenia flava TaxID=2565934 RepID=A0A4S4FZ64_9MICO|nr:Rieske (2Fe-2S) protein [Glaciibacter flavus]THG35036.1 Rieske (2Fe-2S) protein [Glaciibacter flavus]